MVIKDLLDHIGSVIEYAIVEGNKIKVKKAKVEGNSAYIYLYCMDKLGRKTCGRISINISQWGNKPCFEYYIGYWNSKKVSLYLSKEDAYNGLIGKLRQKRQEINKKMLEIQMEVFGKRIE